MNRELQIHKIEPVIIEPDSALVQGLAEQAQAAEGVKPFSESDSAWQIRLAQVKAGLYRIGLDVEAALTEEDDGVDFAVPNVTFEVRIGVEKVYEGKSDAKTGAFVARLRSNIPLEKFAPSFEVVISARDGVGKLTMRVKVDASLVLEEIHGKSRLVEEKVAEDAERQRQIKAEIDKALMYIVTYHDYSAESSFKKLLEHQNHPAVKRGMLKIAQENPQMLAHFIKCFFEAVWAEEVIGSIARQYSGYVFAEFSIFSKCTWSKNIVEQIAKEKPGEEFQGIQHYEYQPWAREVAMTGAGKNPDAAIEYYEQYQDQPWADKVLAFARREKPKNDAARKDHEESQERAEAEEQLCVKTEYESKKRTKMERLAREEAAKWTREALILTASQAGNIPDMIRNFKKYGSQPWAGEVIGVAFSTNPDLVLSMFGYWGSEQPWVRSLVEQFGPSRPSIILDALKWRMKPWICGEVPEWMMSLYIKAIIDISIDGKSTLIILKILSDLFSTSLTERVLREIMESYPQVFIEIYRFRSSTSMPFIDLMRELLVNEFPHLIDQTDDSDNFKHKAKFIEWKREQADPFYKIKRFLRNLFE